MDFYSLLPFLHPTPLTCSLLPYRLVHQMHMFSVILNFFGWPVSWTWCHHQGPISHLALLRVVHQAHALSSWLLQQLLNLNGTSHCRTWDLASQHSLQKAWITHSASMKGLAFHGANFAPKKTRNGMSLNKGLPSYGLFKDESPQYRQSRGIPHTEWQLRWTTCVSSQLIMKQQPTQQCIVLLPHILLCIPSIFPHFCHPGFAPSKQSINI